MWSKNIVHQYKKLPLMTIQVYERPLIKVYESEIGEVEDNALRKYHVKRKSSWGRREGKMIEEAVSNKLDSPVEGKIHDTWLMRGSMIRLKVKGREREKADKISSEVLGEVAPLELGNTSSWDCSWAQYLTISKLILQKTQPYMLAYKNSEGASSHFLNHKLATDIGQSTRNGKLSKYWI